MNVMYFGPYTRCRYLGKMMGDRPNGRACTLAGLGRGRRGRVGQCTVRFCTIENSCYCLPLEFARSGPQFILFAALQVLLLAPRWNMFRLIV